MAKATTAAKALTAAQKRHFGRLVQVLSLADTKLENAQEARDLAMANASQFIDFCAEELGVPAAQGGWAFNQQNMCFEQVPPDEGGEGGGE